MDSSTIKPTSLNRRCINSFCRMVFGGLIKVFFIFTAGFDSPVFADNAVYSSNRFLSKLSSS
jgi:hypothetical protein